MFDFFRKPYKILFIIILAMLIGSIFTTKPLPDLTNGELTESIPSNNGKYILNKYVVDTDSLSSDFIRIEVENTNTNQKRNVYYAHSKFQECEWMTEYGIRIYETFLGEENIVELDIRYDYYDERLDENYGKVHR